jgi:hypothetical protein
MGQIYGPETLPVNQRKMMLGNNPNVVTTYCNPCRSLKSYMSNSLTIRTFSNHGNRNQNIQLINLLYDVEKSAFFNLFCFYYLFHF